MSTPQHDLLIGELNTQSLKVMPTVFDSPDLNSKNVIPRVGRRLIVRDYAEMVSSYFQDTAVRPVALKPKYRG